MASYLKFIWCFTLVTFVSGCATYQSASMPAQLTDVPRSQSDISVVEKGAGVRVTLTDGTTVTGEVALVSEAEIVVESFGNFGFDRRTIAVADIQKIETENYSKSEERLAKTTLIFISVIFVGVAALGYALQGLGDQN